MARDANVEVFGGCPYCGKAERFLNDGRDHWIVCDVHLTKWYIGSNLFSSWRQMSREETIEQRDQLKEYREVESVHLEPPPCRQNAKAG